MGHVKKEYEKSNKSKTEKKNAAKPKKPVEEKLEDVQRLVQLLQIHQVELEHQNQELRIAQEELEESRNKYVNLFDFSPIPYFTLDVNSIIKETNLSAAKMMSIDLNKLIGKSFLAFVPQDYRVTFNAFIQNIFSSDIKHSCELKLINKEKRNYYSRLEGLKTENTPEQGQKCQVAVIDLTDHNEAEEFLNEANGKLKILNATKDKFFSIIAHDLRNPFQALLSSSELLADEIEDLSKEEIKLFSRALNDSLRNLYSLMENLLKWSMMQRNMMEYKPGKIDLLDLINIIIEVLNRTANKKNISIRNNIKNGTLVFADADMLQSVMQNLIINAIKFTKTEGQIIISSVDRNNDFILVSVVDTGIGIEPEKFSKLFNFDTMFTTNGTAGEKGTGLGLPLCKEFIEKNGGEIWAESELGKGAKFNFTLPKTKNIRA